MIEKRCSRCQRLLLIEKSGVKQIKANNIEYSVNGSITVICKCKQVNKL